MAQLLSFCKNTGRLFRAFRVACKYWKSSSGSKPTKRIETMVWEQAGQLHVLQLVNIYPVHVQQYHQTIAWQPRYRPITYVVVEAVTKAFKNERQKREERELRDKQRRYILPDIKIPLTTPLDTEDLQQHLQAHLPPHMNALKLQLSNGLDAHARTNDGQSSTARLQEILSGTSSSLFTSRDNRDVNVPKINIRANTILPPIQSNDVMHSNQPHDASMTLKPHSRQGPLQQHQNVPSKLTKSHGNLSNTMTLSLSEINVAQANREHKRVSLQSRKIDKTSSQSQLPVIAFDDDHMTVDDSDSASVTSSRNSKKTKQSSQNGRKTKKGRTHKQCCTQVWLYFLLYIGTGNFLNGVTSCCTCILLAHCRTGGWTNPPGAGWSEK